MSTNDGDTGYACHLAAGMSLADAPRFRIEDIELFERPVRFRLPFRFGAATLDRAPQAFVRVRIALPGGPVVETGASAEMMMPKWFDKNPALDNAANIDQLRRSLASARDAYLGDRSADTAFGHHARHYRNLRGGSAGGSVGGLVSGFGPALVDRAVIDALGRATAFSFAEMMERNLPGFEAERLAPDLKGIDASRGWVASGPSQSIDVRHTVGLLDRIESAQGMHGSEPVDGLPVTLAEAIGRHGLRWFKVKVSGDASADGPRLASIGALLDRLAPSSRCTLDGNEQFDDISHLDGWWDAMNSRDDCATLVRRVAWIEQPVARARALSAPVRPRGARPPLIIDESDEDLDAFPRALGLGYRGVSSKSCKGLYKTLVNFARIAKWNDTHRTDLAFMSGEDLTMQAGIAVQQDLALESFVGLSHVERNGHHYVNGMQGAPAEEQAAFAHAHPDIYELENGVARLIIRDGRVSTASLNAVGFASNVHPDWSSMQPMPAAQHLPH